MTRIDENPHEQEDQELLTELSAKRELAGNLAGVLRGLSPLEREAFEAEVVRAAATAGRAALVGRHAALEEEYASRLKGLVAQYGVGTQVRAEASKLRQEFRARGLRV